MLAVFQVTTPEAQLNELANTWSPYQSLVNFHLARSASLFETGRSRGIGFRDSNQDCLGVVHLVPERVRERLKDLAATQQSSGGAYHQYQPLTKSGNDEIGGGFNDDPLWLVLAVCAYVRETGRLDLLDEIVPFEDTPETPSTMLDHLEASLGYTQDRLGPHGLPLIGRADWNDCLNLNAHSLDPDEPFQKAPMRTDGRAESVMIAALFVLAGRQAAALYDALDRADEGEAWRRLADDMAKTVEEHGWDGSGSYERTRTRGSRSAAARTPKGVFTSSLRACAAWPASASAARIRRRRCRALPNASPAITGSSFFIRPIRLTGKSSARSRRICPATKRTAPFFATTIRG